MHRALLVDEVLQAIFDNCLDDGKSSLCCIARCCKAWVDPALDRVWRRLPSAVPLLSLLPGYSVDHSGIKLSHRVTDENLVILRKYASRVRHITHCHQVVGDQSSIPGHTSYLLPQLETTRIEFKAIGEVSLRMSLSPRLRQLTVNVGYAMHGSSAFTHDFFSRLKECSTLEHLAIRGQLNVCLELPLRSLTTLQSVSLHLSSLTQQTFLAVSALPLLADLDVHANHLSFEPLSVAVTDQYRRDIPFFPSMAKLRIRAQPAIVELILQHLPRDRLRALHIDAAGSTSQSSWGPVLQAIPMATSLLHDFTLEYSIVDDAQDTQTYVQEKYFTIDHIHPLSNLPLCRFALDFSAPPDLSDADIEKMAKWWPLLERLDLGPPTDLENAEMAWVPKLTLASLFTLAKGCKKLGSLAIFLDVASTIPQPVEEVSHPLSTLLVSSCYEPNTTFLPSALCKLFPALDEVTLGFVGDHEEAWEAVQRNLSILRSLRGHS